MSKFTDGKKAKRADIDCDFHMNKLSIYPKEQKLMLLQDKTLYTFRLTDLTNLFVHALTNSDRLFPNPIPFVNPYTSIPFKNHNLYNIYIAVYFSSFQMNCIIQSFISCSLNYESFKIHEYNTLKNKAIINYTEEQTNPELFLDVQTMLHEFNNNAIIEETSQHNMNYIVTLCKPMLKLFYYSKYSTNSLLRSKCSSILSQKLSNFYKEHNNLLNISFPN